MGTSESGPGGVLTSGSGGHTGSLDGPGSSAGAEDEDSLPRPARTGDLSSGSADAEAGAPAAELGPEEVASADESAWSSQFDAVATALRSLETQVHGFHVRAENYEQIVRQMQSRIEQLQGDQVQALLKPVIQRFAGLHAQATEASEKARERGEAAEKDFSFFAVAIEEALGLVDIESVGAAPGVEFDSGKHHASRVVPTREAHLDQRVQRVLRQGFTYTGAPRVFLPAQVSIYRYEQPPPTDDADASPTTDPTSERDQGDLGE